jgi:hypothetical protein
MGDRADGAVSIVVEIIGIALTDLKGHRIWIMVSLRVRRRETVTLTLPGFGDMSWPPRRSTPLLFRNWRRRAPGVRGAALDV